jgi:hypothetical protein
MPLRQCASLSASPSPSCSSRRPLSYPLTWLGEMKHMAICRIAIRPVRHCRRKRLESCFDPVANGGRRKCSSVHYPAPARGGEIHALPLAISSPYVSTYCTVYLDATAISFRSQGPNSSGLGVAPSLPVCTSPNGSRQQTADKLQLHLYGFRQASNDAAWSQVKLETPATRFSTVANAKPALALSLLLAVTTQQTAPSHSSQLAT